MAFGFNADGVVQSTLLELLLPFKLMGAVPSGWLPCFSISLNCPLLMRLRHEVGNENKLENENSTHLVDVVH